MKRFSLLLVLGLAIALVNIGKVEATHLKAKVPSEAVKQYLADLATGKKPEAPEEFKAKIVSDEFKEYYVSLNK